VRTHRLVLHDPGKRRGEDFLGTDDVENLFELLSFLVRLGVTICEHEASQKERYFFHFLRENTFTDSRRRIDQIAPRMNGDDWLVNGDSIGAWVLPYISKCSLCGSRAGGRRD
jgi:hypothetical protein